MKIIITSSCKTLSNDKIKTMQYNSINSWKWLDCEKEILIFNREESIERMCNELEVKNIKNYESSDFSDLPTWRTMRDIACENATDDDIIVWVNSDIVFDDTLVQTIEQLIESGIDDFILSGKRKNWPNFWELKTKEDLDKIEFDRIGNEYEIDYFVYRKKHFANLPKFYIARMKFDNYLMRLSIDSVDKTIDSTFAINSYHHEHGYGRDLNKSWVEASLNDPEFESDRKVNELLSPISSINDCKYHIKMENKKIIYINEKRNFNNWCW